MLAAALAAACSHEADLSADAPKAGDIVQLRWIAKEADRVAVLTSLPPACETKAGDAGSADMRMLGKLAFESPALLGGAAARMGLSCSSCHLNGRGNPDFFLETLSDKPGTADVTSSVLSRVRGGGNFNPKPIPDIALRDGKQITDRRGSEFTAKVHGLIEEEFDGQVPSPEVFAAVMAYLDGLEPSACGSGDRIAASVARDIEGAEAAAAAGERADLAPETRIFYLRVARFRLERIHERYVSPQQAGLRAELVSASRWLGEEAERLRVGAKPAGGAPDWGRLKEGLQREEARSLYDTAVLRAALAGP